MTKLNYSLTKWSDNAWTFDETDPETNRVIFSSYSWGYPLYETLDDVLHAIGLCEAARAKVQGCAVEDLDSTITLTRRPRYLRARECARDQARLEKLLHRYCRTYTKRDYVMSGFSTRAGVV